MASLCCFIVSLILAIYVLYFVLQTWSAEWKFSEIFGDTLLQRDKFRGFHITSCIQDLIVENICRREKQLEKKTTEKPRIFLLVRKKT